MKQTQRSFSPSRRRFLKTAGLATGALLFDPLLSMGRPVDGPTRELRSRGRPLKIGVMLPASGVYPSLGRNLLAGMRLVVDRVGGQTHDREIDLIPEEIGFGHGLALQKSRQLILEEKVDLVVGVISSEVAARLRYLFEEHRTPLIVTNVGANVVRQADHNPYVFHNSLNYWQANRAMGAWAAANLGATAFVVTSLYDSGYDALHAFRTGFEFAGGKIVQTSVTHASPETDDLNALLAAIKRVGPDFVFGSYCGAPAVDFVQAYARSGLVEHVPLVGSGFMVADDVLAAQVSAALGVRSVFPWAIGLDIPENNAFITAYTRQTGQPPDAIAVLGFDTAQLILKAVEEGGRRNATLRDTLGHVEFASPRGRLKMNAQTHSTASPLYLREVRMRSGPPGNAVVVELDPISELEAGRELSQGSPKTGWLNAYLSV